MASLLDIKIITCTHSFMENLKLQSFIFSHKLQIKLIKRHSKVIRLKVPSRVGIGFDMVSLDKLSVFFVLDCGFHVDEGGGHFELVYWVFELHTVFNIETECHFLRLLNNSLLIKNPILRERHHISCRFVLFHKLGKFPEEDDIVDMVGLKTVGDQVHVKGLNFLYDFCA